MKTGKKLLAMLLTLLMVFSVASIFVSAATADPVREEASAAVARKAGAESMVLLRNNNNALPIDKTKSVAVFGRGAFNMVYGGTGSGAVNNKYNINVYTGFAENGITVDPTIQAFYSGSGTGSAEITPPAAEAVQAAAAINQSAIYVITRISGEGSDRAENQTSGTSITSYNYMPNELATLDLICQYFDKVIVVLNVGGMMDTKAINRADVDAILCAWQGGQEAGRSLADVVTGVVNPSGKLNDSWAINYADYASSADFGNKTYADYSLDPALNAGMFSNNITSASKCVVYKDDIYVGYRYFDTFGKEVAYPFGFGLSYTTFSIGTPTFSADRNTTKSITVTVPVTNTGSVAGKEVVQVYFSAPDGALEKPYQELAAFAKTNLLAPGETQTVTMNFAVADLSSYNPATAQYVIEDGTYYLRIGNSSRNTHIFRKLTVASDIVTEQLTNEYVPRTGNSITYLSKAGATPITYAEEAAEMAAAPSSSLDSRYVTLFTSAVVEKPAAAGFVGAPKSLYVEYHLQAVAEGTITMNQYVAQFSTQELAAMSSASNSSISSWAVKNRSCPGAAAHTNGIERLGLVSMSYPDGPAGIRLTRVGTYAAGVPYAGQAYEHNSTRWPNESAIGCTWNVDLIKEIGTRIGTEMLAFRADVWLAPGLNIHRNPLNGRNFEYYSEDPLITGKCAANVTAGVQSQKINGRGPGVCIKHFCANNQESNRSGTDTIIQERALREIYLKGFEITVRESQPYAIMTSYNRVNGIYTQSSYDLCTNITRGEWGFQGMIMTDWGASGTTQSTLSSGNDQLCSGRNVVTDLIYNLDRDDGTPAHVTYTVGDLQRNAIHVLGTVLRTAALNDYIDTTATLDNKDVTIYPEQTFSITVKTPANVQGVILENEDGMVITQKSQTSTAAEDGSLTWNISTAFGSSGSRILNIVTKVNNVWNYSGATVPVTVTPFTLDVVSASFSAVKVKINQSFNMIITTWDSVTKVAIKNETGADVGKTLVSKVKTGHQITWTYAVSLGTAGYGRTLTAYGYNTAGAVGAGKSASIYVDYKGIATA